MLFRPLVDFGVIASTTDFLFFSGEESSSPKSKFIWDKAIINPDFLRFRWKQFSKYGQTVREINHCKRNKRDSLPVHLHALHNGNADRYFCRYFLPNLLLHLVSLSVRPSLLF